jgi:hypothetical protein
LLLRVAGNVRGYDCVRHVGTGALETAALDDDDDDIRHLFRVRPKLRAQPEDKKTRALDERSQTRSRS